MSMRGHAMGGGRGGGWGGMRSMRQDRAVLQHRVKKGTARRMLTFAVPYRKILAIFIPVVILDAVIAAVNPLILRALIDNGILKNDTDLVIALAVLVAVLALADGALALTERRISAYIGESLIYDMRSKVFRHIQRMPLAFFTRTQTGALVSRLNNDVIGAQQAFTDLLSNVVGNLVTVVIVIAAMFFLSWQITLAALLLVPMFLVPVPLRRPAHRLAHQGGLRPQQRDEHGHAGALPGRWRHAGQAASDGPRPRHRRSRTRRAGCATSASPRPPTARIFFVSLTLTASLATAIVYGVGGVAAVDGALQVGTVVALTSYLTRLYQPLTQLSNVNLDVMTALVSFERLFEVLDIVPMIEEDPDAVDIARGDASIEFDHVRLHLPERRRGLAGLARVGGGARVRPAQRGAPRRVLHRRAGPDGRAGRAVGRGQDDDLEPRPAPLRRDGGVGAAQRHRRAPRDHGLAPRRGRRRDARTRTSSTTRCGPTSCTPGPRRPRPEVLDALDQAQIGHLVGELPDGLDTVIGERGYRLSGGEKQRVALARLMLKAPDIVVLDEATAHLDSESEAAVQRALRQTLAGRTSLVIAHRLSTVREADELFVIDGGRIVERGTHASLLADNGLYAELYRTQFADQEEETEAAEA